MTLELSNRIIFFDVDDTLVSTDQSIPPSYIDERELKRFKNNLDIFIENGWEIGLNSDTPLPLLQKFSKKIGLDKNAPIIFENGCGLKTATQTKILFPFSELPIIKGKICEIFSNTEFTQDKDAIPYTHGGEPAKNRIAEKKWAFGKYRVATISIFSTNVMSKVLIKKLKDIKGIEIVSDPNPKSSFLGIKPKGASKKATLRFILEENKKRKIIMIGNSDADFIDHERAVVGMVQDIKRPLSIGIEKKCIMAKNPTLKGVNELLDYFRLYLPD